MIKFWGHNTHHLGVLLFAALIFASTIVKCECRLMEKNSKKDKEGDQDEKLKTEMNWALEMMSRDEMVKVAGYGEEKLSTVLITGTLVCDNPFSPATPTNHHQLLLPPQPISGALVGATCHSNKKDKSLSWLKTFSDRYGDFIIDLPSHLHSIQNLDKACSITILELPKDSLCYQPDFVRKYKEIKLASVGNGIRTYTTGRLAFQQRTPTLAS